MKLLLITQKVDADDFYFSFFISWIKLMAREFDRLDVICLGKGDFNLPENVRVFSLGKEKGNLKIARLFNFYKLIFGLHYDSVLVHMNPIWVVLGGLVWKLGGKKVFLWYTHKSVTFKLRLAEKIADKIFTASRESFRFESKKVIITGHGIDTQLFKPSQDPTLSVKEPGLGRQAVGQTLRILAGGRITPSKNYETLIEAAKILKKRDFLFKIDIFGEPILESDYKYREKLFQIIKESGLEPNFNFLGKVLNDVMPKLYQEHNLFVHLSRTGSLDKVILEAMACGIKVVSSNDASKTFLPENLIFDNDDPNELAEKIISMSYDPNSDLIDYVVKNHNLNILISKIGKIIKK